MKNKPIFGEEIKKAAERSLPLVFQTKCVKVSLAALSAQKQHLKRK